MVQTWYVLGLKILSIVHFTLLATSTPFSALRFKVVEPNFYNLHKIWTFKALKIESFIPLYCEDFFFKKKSFS